MVFGELAGFFASILATLTFLPQVLKTWRMRDSKSLSAMTLTFSFLGNLGWLINGLAFDNAPLIMSGSLIMLLMLPLFYIKYKNKELVDLAKIRAGLLALFIVPRTDP